MKIVVTCLLFFVVCGCGINEGIERNYIISEVENHASISQEEITKEIQ